jgi:hypothetical protein
MTDRYARVKPLGTCPHASCGRGIDRALQRTGSALLLESSTRKRSGFLDAISDALDRRIEERRIKEPAVH